MIIKSNTVTITVKEKTKKSTDGASKDIPISLDGIQLCILNAERLHVDSHNVSIPTKVALLDTIMWIYLFSLPSFPLVSL